jgi:hypothetical protein
MESGERLPSPATAVAFAGVPCRRNPANGFPCRPCPFLWAPLPLLARNGFPPPPEVMHGVTYYPLGFSPERGGFWRGDSRVPLGKESPPWPISWRSPPAVAPGSKTRGQAWPSSPPTSPIQRCTWASSPTPCVPSKSRPPTYQARPGDLTGGDPPGYNKSWWKTAGPDFLLFTNPQGVATDGRSSPCLLDQ